MSQITKEGVDDLIRKLRITGIFSLRGIGRFIDINDLEVAIVDYIIDKYNKLKDFENSYEFYKYMSTLDNNILKIMENKNDLDLDDIKFKTLEKFSRKYNMFEIYKELENLQFNKATQDSYLKLIDAPTRLEFLISLAIVKKYSKYVVKPNYKIDDEGNPIFTARGGVADIEVYDDDMDTLIEVTLMKNKQQAINEIPAITRHLKDKREKSNKKMFFLFS